MTFEPLGLPGWSMMVLIVGLVVGFPLAGLLAWLFDVTPSGIVKTDLAGARDQPIGLARKMEFALIAALSFALGYFLLQEFRTASLPEQSVERSVAVVPFNNIGDESSYLAAGLTTELANVLAGIPDLRVTSSTSATTAAELGSDAAIGTVLNVAHLVKGSVQKSGQLFRINVQLVRVNDSKVLWSYQTDKNANNIFSLQETIAKNVAASLKSTLYLESLRTIARNGTDSPAAYDAYLLGLHFRTDNWSSVIEHAERAVAIDPNFVAAHLLLADVYNRRVGGTLPAAQAHPLARAALEKVLSLAPENPRALIIQGHLERLDGNFDKAEAVYRRAKALLPNQPTPDLANLLLFQGRVDEALIEFDRSRQIHPGEPGFYTGALIAKGATEEAIKFLKPDLDLTSERWRAITYAQMAQLYAYLGSNELAGQYADMALRETGRHVYYARGILAYALARIGREAEALLIIEDLKAIAATQYVSPSGFFWAYLGVGDLDNTFIALNRAIDEHVYLVTSALMTSPLIDELRRDGRFVAALARLGLAGSVSSD